VKLLVLLSVAAAALALATAADACVCQNAPLEERIGQADAAVVARLVSVRMQELNGAPIRLLTFDVEQLVKDDLPDRIVVQSPSGSDCDLAPAKSELVGLLLTRAPSGTWLGSACSTVDARELIASAGEPRGGGIKVVLGVLALAAVLFWAFLRLRKGTRPTLPGAPQP
jgi:hypothetical protein